MLTIFSVPKPCKGHIGVIQYNAIHSWHQLRSRCQIVLCGNEPGVAELSAEVGARHIPDVRVNAFGTPLLSSVFHRVAAVAENPLLCYVNADIILFPDLLDALQRITWSRFLAVGRRTDLDLRERLNFEKPDWAECLREQVKIDGTLHCYSGIDFMVFARNSKLVNLPDFAVGRPAWDNWFVQRALTLRIPVIDLTAVNLIIHQKHDYHHVPQRSGAAWEGPEAIVNRQLADFPKQNDEGAYTIKDATFQLTTKGLQRSINWSRWARRAHIWSHAAWRQLGKLRPFVRVILFPIRAILYCLRNPSRAYNKLFGLPDRSQVHNPLPTSIASTSSQKPQTKSYRNAG